MFESLTLWKRGALALALAALLAGGALAQTVPALAPAKPAEAAKPAAPAKAKVAKPRPPMQTPKLFATLPDFCPTPDGMAIAPDNGDLIVACPNFKDMTKPGCLLRFSKADPTPKLWVKVPPLAETGVACPMGIEFGPDGDLYVCDNQSWPEKAKPFMGRLLRLRIKNGAVEKCTVVASGMEHPNGVKIRDGYAYVTVSLLSKIKQKSGLLASGVYRFKLDDHDIKVNNTLEDPNLWTTFTSYNESCQYGADGLCFDKAGNLYVGIFGDGLIYKITIGPDGKVASKAPWTQNVKEMRTSDGFCIDEKGNFYVADFSDNAIATIGPKGKIYRIAQSPDSDGSQGELAQPGEPIVWNGKLIVTCFNTVVGPDKVQKKHDKPYTMTSLELLK